MKYVGEISKRPEQYKNKIALGLSILCSLVIFLGFAFYKGYLTLAVPAKVPAKTQAANVVSIEKVPSPFQNSKEALGEAFDEISKRYREAQESISDVLVPFITSIEVYERK
jgi:hypothetical protein